MKTKEIIEQEYNQCIALAVRLENIAGSIAEFSNRDIQQILVDVQMSWRGENAIKYGEKVNLFCEKLIITTESLNNAASKIREIAERIYAMEMQAIMA